MTATHAALSAPPAPAGWEMQTGGAATRYTPSDVPPGDVFTVTLGPSAALGPDSLRQWLLDQIEAAGPGIGSRISTGDIQSQLDGSLLTCVCAFRLASGAQRVVAFSAIRQRGGQARLAWIESSPKRAVFQRYMKDATRLLLALTATENDNGETAASPPRPHTPSPASTPSSSELRRLSYTTTPGAGVPPSQIAGIFSHNPTQFGVGGFVYVVPEPLLALKDGTYYEDLDVPPSAFNAAVARRARPKAWGWWRRTGNTYQIQNRKGAWEDARWFGPLSGGAPGQKLSGTYSHLGGGGNTAYGGGTMIAVSRSLTFFPDGHFQGSHSASVSSHEPTSDVGVVAGSNGANGGTYRIDGYTLELRFGDGTTDRRSFVFMDDTKKALYLNGVAYLREDGK